MTDLLVAVLATITLIAVACLVGRKRQAQGRAQAFEAPETVRRLYLRKDAETGAYWLHAEMKNGRKFCIAPPWELRDMLARLEPVGLRLSVEERAELARASVPAAGASAAVGARGATALR